MVEIVPRGVLGGFVRGGGLYGIQEALGQGHFPPNPTRNNFLDLSGFWDQFGACPDPGQRTVSALN